MKVKGSEGGQAGITLYDRVTGLPYCFFVASGAAQTVAGKCGAVADENQDQTFQAKPSEGSLLERSDLGDDLLTPTSDEVGESQDQTLEPVEEPVVEEPVVEEPVVEDVALPVDAVEIDSSALPQDDNVGAADTTPDNAI